MNESSASNSNYRKQCLGWEPTSVVRELNEGTVHIWLIHLPSVQTTFTLETAWAMIPESEKLRIQRLRVPEVRNKRICIHGLIFHILSHYLAIPAHNIPVLRAVKGKPQIAPNANKVGLEFNISHSNDVAVMAMTVNQPVGIDIEYVDKNRPWNALARRYYHPEEISELETSDEKTAVSQFYQCWTRKEALLKAVGSGLGISLRTVFVGVSGTGKVADVDNDRWHILDIEMPVPYRGAMATLFEPITLCKYYFVYKNNM